MNSKIVLWLCWVGIVLGAKNISELPKSELTKIKLRSKLAENSVEPEKELAYLNSLKRQVGWFSRFEDLKELAELTCEGIESEKKEIEILKGILKENKKSDELMKLLEENVKEILPAKTFSEAEALIIKKWLIARKFLKTSTGTAAAKDIQNLTSEPTSAIKILQNVEGNDLLRTLAGKVKVNNWPIDLNIARLLSKHRMRNIFTAKDVSKYSKFKKTVTELINERKIVEGARRDMQEILLKARKTVAVEFKDDDCVEEIDLRMKLIEHFMTTAEGKEPLTVFLIDLRVRAFEKMIDKLMEKLETQSKDVEISKVDLLMIRKWLLFNQMLLAVDWVTRSGKFVKEWPKGFEIDRYKFPSIEDNGGYFGNLKEKAASASVKVEEKKDVSLKSRISKFFKGKQEVSKLADKVDKAMAADKVKSNDSKESEKTRSKGKGFWSGLTSYF